MISRAMLERLPNGAVLMNTVRAPIVDVEALAELLKRGHLAGVGLNALPVEPPVKPVPELLRAYRARHGARGGSSSRRTPAFFTPEACGDTRLTNFFSNEHRLGGPSVGWSGISPARAHS